MAGNSEYIVKSQSFSYPSLLHVTTPSPPPWRPLLQLLGYFPRDGLFKYIEDSTF